MSNLTAPARFAHSPRLAYNWTLNQIIVLVLAAVFLGLCVDLRYEHVDKVRHHLAAWIPIVYSGIMVLACAAGLAFWNRRGREWLSAAFAVGVGVGLLGFWLHNGTHIVARVAAVLMAWFRPEHLADAPPTLAPLTFAGLGVVGMIVCLYGRQQH